MTQDGYYNTLLNISQSRKLAIVLFCQKNHNLQEKALSPYTLQTKQRQKMMVLSFNLNN